MAAQVITDKKAREKPCLRCGYSLRHLTDTRHCPECGLSVWLSLNDDDALDRSNPQWLTKLALAAGMLSAAQLLGLALWIGFWFLDLSHRLQQQLRLSSFSAGLLAMGAYLTVAHAAMLLLSMPEHRHPDHLRGYRRTLRVAAVAGLVVGPFLVSQALLRVVRWFPSIYLWATFHFLATIVLLGGAAATLAYLRLIARRVPNHFVARSCEWLLLVPALMCLFAAPYIGLIFLWNLNSIVRYIPLGFLPATFALSIWCAVTFRKSGASAQREWTSETIR